jgi:hypothetical protein
MIKQVWLLWVSGYDITRCGMAWYGIALYCIVWHFTTSLWNDLARYGVIINMAWYGLVKNTVLMVRCWCNDLRQTFYLIFKQYLQLTNVPLYLQNYLWLRFELQNPVRWRHQTCWTNEEVPMDLLVSRWMIRSMWLDCSSFRSAKNPRRLCVCHTTPRES